MVAVAGLLGAAVLPVAWLFHAYRTYEAGNLAAVDPVHVALFAAGSGLLTVHAVRIGDVPFLLAHATMTMFTATELALIVRVRQAQE